MYTCSQSYASSFSLTFLPARATQHDEHRSDRVRDHNVNQHDTGDPELNRVAAREDLVARHAVSHHADRH